MKLDDIEIGKTYTFIYKGRITEAIAVNLKLASEDVIWSSSQREAVLLKLPSGRYVARIPGALSKMKDQLELFREYGEKEENS